MMEKNNRSAMCVLATLFAYLLCIFTLKLAFDFEKVRAHVFAWSMGGEYLGDEDVVFQRSSNDCGPAALMMIFAHYDIAVDTMRIAGEMNLGQRGTSMLALKQCAEHHGLSVSAQRIAVGELRLATFPLLIYFRGCHFAVIDSLIDDYALLRDPRQGKVKYHCDTLNKIWQGECLMFSR